MLYTVQCRAGRDIKCCILYSVELDGILSVLLNSVLLDWILSVDSCILYSVELDVLYTVQCRAGCVVYCTVYSWMCCILYSV